MIHLRNKDRDGHGKAKAWKSPSREGSAYTGMAGGGIIAFLEFLGRRRCWFFKSERPVWCLIKLEIWKEPACVGKPGKAVKQKKNLRPTSLVGTEAEILR